MIITGISDNMISFLPVAYRISYSEGREEYNCTVLSMKEYFILKKINFFKSCVFDSTPTISNVFEEVYGDAKKSN